jgi:hypothetical protein
MAFTGILRAHLVFLSSNSTCYSASQLCYHSLEF